MAEEEGELYISGYKSVFSAVSCYIMFINGEK